MLILRDTRESGEMLQAALAAGVSAAGGDALLGGVLPTPAAPLLIARYGFDLAAVLSASHNPYQDNGIKFFAADGYKLSDEAEAAIERELDAAAARAADRLAGRSAAGDGRIRELRGAAEDYLRELHTRFRELDLERARRAARLRQRRHLRTSHPEIFRRLGAHVTAVADRARRAQHQRRLRLDPHRGARRAGASRAATRIGFAFDGDGDRVLAVDRRGEVVDGDELMALAALHLHAGGRLSGNGVAVTVMTNYGFHSAMEQAGVVGGDARSVGDRYVLEELRARGWTLGGEQSGHIIEMGFNSTGDGIASALLTLEALGGRDLSERDAMAKLPQRLVNVPRPRPRRPRGRARARRGGPQRRSAALRAGGACSCARAAPSRSCG